MIIFMYGYTPMGLCVYFKFLVRTSSASHQWGVWNWCMTRGDLPFCTFAIQTLYTSTATAVGKQIWVCGLLMYGCVHYNVSIYHCFNILCYFKEVSIVLFIQLKTQSDQRLKAHSSYYQLNTQRIWKCLQ